MGHDLRASIWPHRLAASRNPTVVGTGSWRKMNKGVVLRLTGGPDAWAWGSDGVVAVAHSRLRAGRGASERAGATRHGGGAPAAARARVAGGRGCCAAGPSKHRARAGTQRGTRAHGPRGALGERPRQLAGWAGQMGWRGDRGGELGFFYFIYFLLFLFIFIHKKSHKLNGYSPRQYVKHKIKALQHDATIKALIGF
jgi:hypothetical protein